MKHKHYWMIASNIFLIFIIFFTHNTTVITVTHPRPKVEKPVWDTAFIQTYTLKYMVKKYPNWQFSEFTALKQLWQIESHWNPKAYNSTKDRWSGLYAGGIPQLLGMKTTTPAPQQVERGLAYISYRYGKPSKALQFHKIHNWY